MLSSKDFVNTINMACGSYINFILFWIAFCFTGVLKNIQVMLFIIPNLRRENEDKSITNMPFKIKSKMQFIKIQSLCYHMIGVVFLPFAFTSNIRYNLIANAVYFDVNCVNLIMPKELQINFDFNEWIDKVKKGDSTAMIPF